MKIPAYVPPLLKVKPNRLVVHWKQGEGDLPSEAVVSTIEERVGPFYAFPNPDGDELPNCNLEDDNNKIGYSDWVRVIETKYPKRVDGKIPAGEFLVRLGFRPNEANLVVGVHTSVLTLVANGRSVSIPVVIHVTARKPAAVPIKPVAAPAAPIPVPMSVSAEPTTVTPTPVAVPELAPGVGSYKAEVASELVANRDINVFVVFVKFEDVDEKETLKKETMDALKRRLTSGKQLERSFLDQSYGNCKLNITWGDQWQMMPGKVEKYVTNAEKNEWNYKLFVREAVELVPDGQDPDIVIAFVPNTDKFIIGSGGHNVTVNRMRKDNFRQVNIGFSFYRDNEHYTTLMHEIGHNLGLHDLYPYNEPFTHKVGPWDIMSDIQYATGFLAWNRKLFGWLGADRMTFLKTGDVVWRGKIEPSSAKSGVCMVAVCPEGQALDAPNELYIVQVAPEVRGRTGHLLSEEGIGLLVYKVRAAGKDDQKPLEVISNLPNKDSDTSWGLIESAPFKAGKKYDRPDLPFTLNVVSGGLNSNTGEIAKTFEVEIQVKPLPV